MNVNGKYIKDENGNIISPITSFNTVFDSKSRNLDSVLGMNLLWEGNVEGKATLALSDNYDKYKVIYILGQIEFGSTNIHGGICTITPSQGIENTLLVYFSNRGNGIGFEYTSNVCLQDNNKLCVTGGTGYTFDANRNVTGSFVDTSQIRIRSVYGNL